MLTSPQLSKKMEDAAARGSSEIVFLIGSSYGLHPTLKQRADARISFSRMTFPHQLARVMLLEQIYRAAQIAHGAPYHK
jgi:23S rRNA (pseudouridine1915-N3)-methyltransferase